MGFVGHVLRQEFLGQGGFGGGFGDGGGGWVRSGGKGTKGGVEVGVSIVLICGWKRKG